MDSFLTFFTPRIVWAIFGIFLFIIMLAVLALRYHWKGYDTIHRGNLSKFEVLYYVGTVLLLLISFLAAFSFGVR